MNLNLNLKRREGNSDLYSNVALSSLVEFFCLGHDPQIYQPPNGVYLLNIIITHSSSFTCTYSHLHALTFTYPHLPSLICTHLQLHAPSFIYTHLPSRTRAYLHSYHMHSPSLICTSTYIPVNEKDG